MADEYGAERIRQQIEWQGHRSVVKNPAGALVQAIREEWPAPKDWVQAQAQAAVVKQREQERAAQAAEDERRRQEWEAQPEEERVRGRLEFWLVGQQRKGRQPSGEEIAARRAALIAELRAERIDTRQPTFIGGLASPRALPGMLRPPTRAHAAAFRLSAPTVTVARERTAPAALPFCVSGNRSDRGRQVTESERRERYERLYADYREAGRAHIEARVRGAGEAELRGLRERKALLWALLAAWRGTA